MLSDYMTRSVINSVLPDLKREWALGDGQLGLLVSVVPLIVGIAAWPVALLADRWGYVKSVTAMASIWGVATILCGLAQNHSQMLMARAAVGLGEAGYGAVGAAVLSTVFPAARMSAVLGAFQAAAVFGTVLGVVAGDRGAATGFLTVVKRVHEFWSQQPDRIREDAETITRLVKAQLASRRQIATQPLDAKFLGLILDELEQQYDPEWGGFGYVAAQPQRPKFPEPSNLLFLLERLRNAQVRPEDKERAQRMLVKTLEQMAMGGDSGPSGGWFPPL